MGGALGLHLGYRPGAVDLDGPGADAQLVGDHLVLATDDRLVEHLAFAWAEEGDPCRCFFHRRTFPGTWRARLDDIIHAFEYGFVRERFLDEVGGRGIPWSGSRIVRPRRRVALAAACTSAPGSLRSSNFYWRANVQPPEPADVALVGSVRWVGR